MAWEVTNGPILDGQHVLHRCDVPACCNPARLFLGTPSDNSADMARKQRSCMGIRNPHAVLNDQKVREIKLMLDLGERPTAVARHFGVNDGTIRDIEAGRTWKHVVG